MGPAEGVGHRGVSHPAPTEIENVGPAPASDTAPRTAARIADGRHELGVRGIGCPGGHLDRHDLHAVRDPGPTQAVISYFPNDSGDCRTVVVIGVRRIRVGGVRHEVPPIDVIDVAIAVIVHAGGARSLSRVLPDAQVRMIGLHAIVQYSDHDVAASGRESPGFRSIDVGVGGAPGLARVVQMPLTRVQRICGVFDRFHVGIGRSPGYPGIAAQLVGQAQDGQPAARSHSRHELVGGTVDGPIAAVGGVGEVLDWIDARFQRDNDFVRDPLLQPRLAVDECRARPGHRRVLCHRLQRSIEIRKGTRNCDRLLIE